MTDPSPIPVDHRAVPPGSLRVGCAMWANKAWVGRHFPPTTSAGSELAVYSTWCTTVEGNTTFYAVPSPATIDRWVAETDESFRFCFKLPRTITHDRRLRNAEVELTEFLERLDPLGQRLGPIQVQLPASFAPADLPALLSFLDHLPDRFPWAVELRHPDFFAGGSHERAVDDALAERGVNRVILDSRALFAGHPVSREEIEAWENKPRLPVRPVATGASPMVRLIGQSDLDASLDVWAKWVPKVAEWLLAGLEPHVFTHTPDNVDAPPLARRFFELLDRHLRCDHGIVLTPLPEPITSDEQLGLW